MPTVGTLPRAPRAYPTTRPEPEPSGAEASQDTTPIILNAQPVQDAQQAIIDGLRRDNAALKKELDVLKLQQASKSVATDRLRRRLSAKTRAARVRKATLKTQTDEIERLKIQVDAFALLAARQMLEVLELRRTLSELKNGASTAAT